MITPAYSGPANAEVLLVGEAWGFREANNRPKPAPFVGPSGQLLDEMLSSAGYPRSRIRVTNVVHAMPPRNKIELWLTDTAKKAEKLGLTIQYRGRWMNETVKEGIDELHREIARLQPKLIIAMGNTPLWALTGEWGITQWRGSEMRYEADAGPTDIPVIPTLHPAYVLRAWAEKPVVIHDLRVRAFGKLGQDANREPPWNFRIDPHSVDVLRSWLGPIYDGLEAGPFWVATDVETRRFPRPRTVCIGFGWSELDAVCIPLEHADGSPYWSDEDWPVVYGMIQHILSHPNYRPIGQNFNYDAQYNEQDFNIRRKAAFDTATAQHLLFPGTQKDLARLSSLYCAYHYYWKDDLKDWASDWDELRMWRYNCIDNVRTYEIAQRQMPALVKMGLHKGDFLK